MVSLPHVVFQFLPSADKKLKIHGFTLALSLQSEFSDSPFTSLSVEKSSCIKIFRLPNNPGKDQLIIYSVGQAKYNYLLRRVDPQLPWQCYDEIHDQ